MPEGAKSHLKILMLVRQFSFRKSKIKASELCDRLEIGVIDRFRRKQRSLVSLKEARLRILSFWAEKPEKFFFSKINQK